MLASPGRGVQSVAQASFDAWVKYYRGDENTPNATISYYTKGSLVALALDLTLRARGQGSLDDVMRLLWERSGGGPIGEADIAEALHEVGGRPMADELRAWVNGTDDLPLQSLLQRAAVRWTQQAPTMAQRLGLRVSESALTGIKVTHVLRGGAAEAAGLAAGDELVGVDGWRLRRLDDLQRLLPADGRARLLAARDQRLLTLSLEAGEAAEQGAIGLAPAPLATDKAAVAAQSLRQAWMRG